MKSAELTERQIREKNYYTQYAHLFDLNQEIDYAPIEGPLLGKETRPWNSYWRTYQLAVDYFLNNQHNTQIKLLDFGCGPGDNSLRFSRIGVEVTGFDISDANIENCKKVFEKFEGNKKGNFLVSTAENLPFETHSFEIVAGIDILHHVDIPKAMLEIKRVLKPNGIAIFREPIEVPFLDQIRNLKIVTAFFPNKPSLDHHITEDERKLNDIDLKVIKDIFPNTTIERSLILSRADKFIRNKNSKSASFLERLDYGLTKVIPFWGKLGGAAVIIIKN